ncbi:MAG: MltA domain-containing protein, partial [Acidobacteriota bacterium]
MGRQRSIAAAFALAAGAALLAACGAPRSDVSPSVDAEAVAQASTALDPATVDAATALRPVRWADAEPFIDEGAAAEGWGPLRTALGHQRRWLRNRPADRLYTYGPRKVSVTELRRGVDQLLAWLGEDPSPETFGARVARHFDLFESVGDGAGDPKGDVLVTGYYVPEIEGSLTRRPGYSVPIYRPPGGLVRADLGAFNDEWKGRRIAGLLRGSRLVPFPDRNEIRTGDVPELRGRVLAWAADPTDLFFVEVQGSGILRLPDGTRRRFGYAGANGRAYRSIGKLLIDEGHVPREKMSMQAIRAWLNDHPDELHRVLDHNTSVVFFRFLDGPPVGNLGLPVTAGRSLAVDQKLMPPGGVGFLVTERPTPGTDGTTAVDGEIRRFIVAQDTGGAIRGAARADFFWGAGDDA